MFILKGDAEWLRLCNQMYRLMNLGCTQCLPEPAVLTAIVVDDRATEWVRRKAEQDLRSALLGAGRADGAVWKAENTMLVME